jgi:adenine phosphoribosyltransferase
MSAPVSPDDPTAPLHAAIRDVPDFPKAGIVFKDIMPILAKPETLRLSIDLFESVCRGLPEPIDKIVGIDARGFLFGAALAYKLGVGFIPVRKAGKLPGKIEAVAYTLEYGESTVEMLSDALSPGERVVLIDDLLATGGTAAAAIKLIEKLGAKTIAALFLVELEFLHGRARLTGVPVHALLRY